MPLVACMDVGRTQVYSRARGMVNPNLEGVMAKNEIQCARCGRWFWAWGTGRTVCYACDPEPISGTVLAQAIADGRVKL
jgi:hypothetical protein